jgi:hypothetical protein
LYTINLTQGNVVFVSWWSHLGETGDWIDLDNVLVQIKEDDDDRTLVYSFNLVDNADVFKKTDTGIYILELNGDNFDEGSYLVFFTAEYLSRPCTIVDRLIVQEY